jgi:hypothetical protein
MRQVASQPTTAPADNFPRSAAAGMLAANASTTRLTESIRIAIVAACALNARSSVPLLPKQPDPVHGVLNLRDAMTPTIGPRRRFGQGE